MASWPVDTRRESAGWLAASPPRRCLLDLSCCARTHATRPRFAPVLLCTHPRNETTLCTRPALHASTQPRPRFAPVLLCTHPRNELADSAMTDAASTFRVAPTRAEQDSSETLPSCADACRAGQPAQHRRVAYTRAQQDSPHSTAGLRTRMHSRTARTAPPGCVHACTAGQPAQHRRVAYTHAQQDSPERHLGTGPPSGRAPGGNHAGASTVRRTTLCRARGLPRSPAAGRGSRATGRGSRASQAGAARRRSSSAAPSGTPRPVHGSQPGSAT